MTTELIVDQFGGIHGNRDAPPCLRPGFIRIMVSGEGDVMPATKTKRRKPRRTASLRESLYDDVAKLADRLPLGPKIPATDEDGPYTEALAGANECEGVPRRLFWTPEIVAANKRHHEAMAKRSASAKAISPEEKARAEEEMEFLADLPTDDDFASGTDCETDSAECSSFVEFDPDYDPAPFLEEIERRRQEEEQLSGNTDETPEAEVCDPETRLRSLVAKANTGDTAALAEMRKMLDEHREIWVVIGDLAAHAELSLINLVADGNTLMAESMQRHVRQLRSNLLTDASSQLERLTVQRVVACWLGLQHVDRACAISDAGETQNNTWARRQATAEKRYQTALKSLKLVREMSKMTQPRETKEQNTKQAAAERPEHQPSREDTQHTCSSPATASNDNGRCRPTSGNNGHARRMTGSVLPKANGRPINRIQGAVSPKEPVLAGA